MIPTPHSSVTGQAPTSEPKYVSSQAAQRPISSIPPAPDAPTALPPAGWYIPSYGTQPVIQPQQQLLYRPTGGQRVGVAVASIALLIPLVAIALSTMTSLMPYVTAGVAVSAGLIAVALICLAVVVVNIAFNFDLIRPKQ